ncbi:MAG: hypothetical protein ACXVB1_18270 [Pseudobdellovibrionaceae bacterium]
MNDWKRYTQLSNGRYAYDYIDTDEVILSRLKVIKYFLDYPQHVPVISASDFIYSIYDDEINGKYEYDNPEGIYGFQSYVLSTKMKSIEDPYFFALLKAANFSKLVHFEQSSKTHLPILESRDRLHPEIFVSLAEKYQYDFFAFARNSLEARKAFKLDIIARTRDLCRNLSNHLPGGIASEPPPDIKDQILNKKISFKEYVLPKDFYIYKDSLKKLSFKFDEQDLLEIKNELQEFGKEISKGDQDFYYYNSTLDFNNHFLGMTPYDRALFEYYPKFREGFDFLLLKYNECTEKTIEFFSSEIKK